MGLSRNKVAVSEGAAGSPPFYGESGRALRRSSVFRNRQLTDLTSCLSTAHTALAVQFLRIVQRSLKPLWGCSSAGRAPALQAGGQGFDSLHLHQRQCRTRSPREESKERKEAPAFATRSDTEVRLKMNRINNHREITVCSSGG